MRRGTTANTGLPAPPMVYRGRTSPQWPQFRLDRTGKLVLAASVLFVLSVIAWGYAGVESQDRSNDRYLDTHGAAATALVTGVLPASRGEEPTATVTYRLPSGSPATAEVNLPENNAVARAQHIEITYDPQNTGLARWNDYPDRSGSGASTTATTMTVITAIIALAAVLSGLWNRRQKRRTGRTRAGAGAPPTQRTPPAGQQPRTP